MIEKFTSYYITLVFTPQLMCCEQAFGYTNYFFNVYPRRAAEAAIWLPHNVRFLFLLVGITVCWL